MTNFTKKELCDILVSLINSVYQLEKLDKDGNTKNERDRLESLILKTKQIMNEIH